jgi:hypothetical protein
MLFDLWNWLKGKKTYFLAMICMAMVLLRAISEALSGTAVDWENVMHQMLTCLITMALRHAVAGNGNGHAPPPSVDESAYRTFDR